MCRFFRLKKIPSIRKCKICHWFQSFWENNKFERSSVLTQCLINLDSGNSIVWKSVWLTFFYQLVTRPIFCYINQLVQCIFIKDQKLDTTLNWCYYLKFGHLKHSGNGVVLIFCLLLFLLMMHWKVRFNSNIPRTNWRPDIGSWIVW